MTATVTDINANKPHKTSLVLCPCGYYWTAVYPVGTEELECPSCGQMRMLPKADVVQLLERPVRDRK